MNRGLSRCQAGRDFFESHDCALGVSRGQMRHPGPPPNKEFPATSRGELTRPKRGALLMFRQISAKPSAEVVSGPMRELPDLPNRYLPNQCPSQVISIERPAYQTQPLVE